MLITRISYKFTWIICLITQKTLPINASFVSSKQWLQVIKASFVIDNNHVFFSGGINTVVSDIRCIMIHFTMIKITIMISYKYQYYLSITY